MSPELVPIEMMAKLRAEISALEKEMVRAVFPDIAAFRAKQGELFGLERALEVIHKVIREQDDEI